MESNNPQPIEGEVVEAKPRPEILRQAQDENPQRGIFIGTLNIMTQPARDYLTEPLSDIYKNRYEGKYKRPKHVFLFDAMLVAIGAALAAISIYFGLIYKPFEPLSAKLTIMPNAPVSGGEVIVTLTVSNNTQDTLTNVSATFKLPPQLKMKRSSLPYQRASNTVNFDTLAPGADATERIVADLSGNVGQNLKAIANVTYTDERTDKTTSRGAAASAKIAGSSVKASLELSENAVAGQYFSGAIRYSNRGSAAIPDVVIIPNWPSNFSFASSEPALKNGAWRIGTLAAGSEGKISFRGMLNAGGDVEFGVETGVSLGGEILSQAQESATVSVTDPQISATIDGAAAARLGDTVSLTVTYKNGGDHIFNGASIKAIAAEGLQITGSDSQALGDLKPGASGTFKIAAKIGGTLPDALAKATDPQLAIRASLSGKLDGENGISISSPEWKVKIATDLGLSSSARYWSETGDQLGRGPLPPTVGKATRYWIFWNVKNTSGAANDVRVTGTLPANASFTGKASVPFGDAPIYDPATRVLTWNVGDVAAWPGVTSQAINAAFEVSLTPTPDQIGTYPPLMTAQKITGTDAATGVGLSGTATDITARLSTDPLASGKGPVK